MMKFTFLICLIILSLVNNAQACLYPVPLEEKLAHATQVVEGLVASQHTFWNPTHTMIFTSCHVRITKQFKGSTPAGGYMDVLTYGGSVGTYYVEVSDLLDLQTGGAGIFCAYPNSFGLTDPQTGALLYDVWAGSQGFFLYDPATHSANAPFARYPNIERDLYPKLVQDAGHPYKVIGESFRAAGNSAQKAASAITGFTPTNIHAGATDDPTNNVLTITGSGFSSSPSGACAVYFDNADDGPGGMYVGVSYLDPRMVSWTATQIQLRVPKKAGTGSFYITDNGGATIATSSSNLVIDYAVQDVLFSNSGTNYVREFNLMNTDGAGGYTIQYSNNASGSGVDFNASAAKPTFQRALNTWKTLVGFNVTESSTTTSVQVINSFDGVNVIEYDNTNTGVGVLPAGTTAVCTSGGGICTATPSTTEGYQKVGFDVVVRSPASAGAAITAVTGPCPPSTSATEYDLETVLLHELGHAIGHGHIIDGIQGSSLPHVNPSKLMNYAVTNGVKRVSPDWSALTGSQYLVQPGYGSHTYPGTCAGYFTTEMTPLTATIDAHDECPATFPTQTISPSTTVSFNLARATSNKNTDPQYTAVNGMSTGVAITNTVFYPFVTNAAASASLNITVSGYATTPASQASCNGQGVELAIYQANSCPTGQSYPAPVAARSFSGNGALTSITGLSPNTHYLMVMDGMDNTFAAYTLSFTGSTALPIEVLSFSGNAEAAFNHIFWKLAMITTLQSLEVERSSEGQLFTAVSAAGRPAIMPDGFYDDLGLLPATAYYRLKLIGLDAAVTYSNVVSLRRAEASYMFISQAGGTGQPMLFAEMMQPASLRIALRDLSGRLLWEKAVDVHAGSNKIGLALPDLSEGLYLLLVEDAEHGIIYSQKLIH